MRRFDSMAALTLAIVIWAYPTLARGGAAADVAKESFHKGVQLYNAKDYKGALAEFLAAYEAKPHHSVLYNIAQCYQMTDDNAKALDFYERYLKEGADYVDEERKAEILEEIEKLKLLLCPLALDVLPDGATVSLDGKTLGTSPVAKIEYIEPGEHHVSVQKDGWAPFTKTFVAKRDEAVKLEIALVGENAGGKLSVKSSVDGAVVLVDGVEVGPAPWEGGLAVGMHLVVVQAEGLADATSEVEISAGEKTIIELGPAPIEGGSGKDLLVGKEAPPAKKKLHPGVFAGAAGLAVASGAAAVALGVLDAKHRDEFLDLRDEIRDGTYGGSDPEGAYEDSKAKGQGLNGGFVATLGMAAAGVVLAAVLAPFTDFGGKKKKVEVKPSASGGSIAVFF